jgi:Glycosyltransferase family 10 (fucosyltransferase).
MKKIAIWNNYTCFSHNRAFNLDSYGIGEDIGYPVIYLKNELEKIGYTVETLDMDMYDKYDKILFLDYPNPETCCCDVDRIPREKKYLLLTECEMINKDNSALEKHNKFHKVFSYNDNYVAENGYIKLNIPNRIKPVMSVGFTDKKFCTMIVGNKRSREKGELYSARLDVVSFFEKQHADEFDLYGVGWDKRVFYGPRLIRGLNRLEKVQKAFVQKHVCYKGKVDHKLSTLARYKYSICYENTCLIPGYISEKIWDCFFAGCIPVYWGAPNIEKYVPRTVFIDRRDFSSNSALYYYLKNINEYEYQNYIDAIKAFLASESAYQFSAEKYAETIIESIFE